MEIKASLDKPYTEKQRMNFIVQYNHKLGYEIKETDVALEAWGYTKEELLEQAKQSKYNEANLKAKEYLQSGEALYEFEEGKHIEATDGNIGKFTGYALGFVTGQHEPTDTVPWNTKEDENVDLTATQVNKILNGMGTVQAVIWTVKYPAYVLAIDEATTVEEVEAIIINYESKGEPEEKNITPVEE